MIYPNENYCEDRNPANHSGHCFCIEDRGHEGEHRCTVGHVWSG